MIILEGVIAMFRKIILPLLIVIVLTTGGNTASAREWYDDYYLDDILDVPVTKVLTCTNYETGEVDHTVYYQAFVKDLVSGNLIMPRFIIVCHGVDMGNDYSYKIAINGRQRADYAEAVEEVMQRWEREGYLNNYTYYLSILVHTCFSGRARYQNYTLTNFHKTKMTFSTDNKNINAHSERYVGNVLYLTLYSCTPRIYNDGVLDTALNRAREEKNRRFAGRNIKISGR